MENIVKNLLLILNQIKMYHWQTESFAQHKALGNTYDSLNDLIDNFVEILIGKYGRDVLVSSTLNIRRSEDLDLGDSLNSILPYLINLTDVLDQKSDSDLLNVRDEMLGEINKLKYLLTLK